jgi:hypothetical protein
MADAEKFKDSVEDKTLFLSLTAKTKVKYSKIAYQWFSKYYVVDFGNIDFEKRSSEIFTRMIFDDQDYKRKLEQFLIAIDTGIKGISVKKIGGRKEDEVDSYNIYSLHAINDQGDTTEIPFDQESSGT